MKCCSCVAILKIRAAAPIFEDQRSCPNFWRSAELRQFLRISAPAPIFEDQRSCVKFWRERELSQVLKRDQRLRINFWGKELRGSPKYAFTRLCYSKMRRCLPRPMRSLRISPLSKPNDCITDIKLLGTPPSHLKYFIMFKSIYNLCHKKS